MKTISLKDFLKEGKDLFGEDRLDWKFKCSSRICGNIQSGNSIIKQMKEGIASKRHGILKKGDELNPDSECYSPDCNWVAYGLFRSGILIIQDPDKPYNIDRYENCKSVFSFAEYTSAKGDP